MVVTHHCPHPRLIADARRDIDPAYGSDLLPLIEQHQPDDWWFGHTHHRVEIDVGRTCVRNLSLGYPGEVAHGNEAEILLPGLIQTGTLSGDLT